MKTSNTLAVLVFSIFLSINNNQARANEGFYADFSSGQVTAGQVAELNGASAFTLETKVYVDQLTTWTHLLSKASGSTNRISLQMHNGKVYCIVSNGANAFSYTPSAVLSVGKWYHLAMTYDGSAATPIKLYVDGVSVNLSSSSNAIPSTAPTNTATFKAAHAKLKGSLDEVRVWDSSLSAATIGAWYDKKLDSTHPAYSTNLVLSWDFEDYASVSTVNAADGTAYNGTPVNMTYDRQHVGGYIMYQNVNKLTSDVADHLTHIFYFSLAPKANGDLGRFTRAGVFTHVDSLPNVGTEIATLNSWRVGKNSKLFLVLGGWVQSDQFDEAASNATSRAALINNVKDFAITHGLDGVDLDWEGYKGGVNATNYGLLVSEMKAGFAGTGLEISATVGASKHHLADEFEAHTDFVQLMTYGRNIKNNTQMHISTLKTLVNNWVSRGLSRSKLIIGLPAFARPKVVSTPDSMTYKNIVDNFAPAANVDVINNNGVNYYFNGTDTIKLKSRYARKELKGVMFWEVRQDVDVTETNSLINAATDVIKVSNTGVALP